MKEQIECVKQLVGKNKLKQAVTLSIAIAQQRSSEQRDKLLLLSRDIHSLAEYSSNGLITFENEMIVAAKLASRLFAILSMLEEEKELDNLINSTFGQGVNRLIKQ